MDPNISTETGESVQGRSPRFTLWVAFLVFSTITLGSSVQVNDKAETKSSSSKYAVACSAATFAVTVFVVLSHLWPTAALIFVGTRFEGLISFIMVILWAAVVAIVTNANDGLAVPEDATNQVQNANLYYFSWAGFITSIVLFVSYLRSVFGVDVVGAVKNRATRLSWWAGMLATAVVVMGSAARSLKDDCGQSNTEADFSESYCRKTKFAVSVGAVGVVFSIVVVGMKFLTTTAPFMAEFAVACMLAVLNAFGVAYTTSADGPGSGIGNLYYFSWGSLMCAAVLAAECFNEFLSGGSETETTTNGENGHKPQSNGDVQVETFDDQI